MTARSRPMARRVVVRRRGEPSYLLVVGQGPRRTLEQRHRRRARPSREPWLVVAFGLLCLALGLIWVLGRPGA